MSYWQSLKRFFIVDLTTSRDPFSLGHWEQQRGPSPEEQERQQARLPGPYEGDLKNEQLSSALTDNLKRLKTVFSVPTGLGLIIHRLPLGDGLPVETGDQAEPPPPSGQVPSWTPPGSEPEEQKGVQRQAALIYISGLIDVARVDRTVIHPLLMLDPAVTPQLTATDLARGVLREAQAHLEQKLGRLVNELLDGSAAVLLDGDNQAIVLQVMDWAKRGVERPQAEITVRGAQEAFTEDLQTNITLVRKRLRTPNLVIEAGRIGRLSRAWVTILYLKDVTNPEIVAETRRRLAAMELDYVSDSGVLAQYIDDNPGSTYPGTMLTERPDRVTASLSEGYVAILLDSDPHAVILPITIISLLHSPEDIYLRFPVGTFLRLTRVASYYTALMLPATYIGLANFRQEMIPTSLLLAIANSRETVPFSVVLEVLLMEASFELIHEAALRVPSVIGPTIGIVGTLILGQAAVQAGIISPILVIITAATALAAFAIPNYDLQMATRLWRFLFIAVASLMGLAGIILLHTAYVAYLCSLTSFGVPYMAPLSPLGSQKDTLRRSQIFQQEKRPSMLRPLTSRQQADVVRPWDPAAPSKPQKGGDADDRS